jgi:hypothetical protein
VHFFAYYSPTLGVVWKQPQSRLCDFAVKCKECGETFPAPVGTMPGSATTSST